MRAPSSHRLQNLAFLLVCALPGTARSANVTIDFEDLAVGDSVTDHYLDLGVRFEAGSSELLIVDAPQEGTSARKHALEVQGPSPGVHKGALKLHFTHNVRFVQIFCGYRFPCNFDLSAALQAYDAAGNLLGEQLIDLGSKPITQVPLGPSISFDAGSYLIRRVKLTWMIRNCFTVLPGAPRVCLPPVDAELSELIGFVRFTDDSVRGQFIRGDADGSGELTIGDAIRTLSYLFVGAAAVRCLDAADSNDSGVVDLSDATYTLGFLFLGGRAPPSPFPRMGDDPTGDGIGCTSGI